MKEYVLSGVERQGGRHGQRRPGGGGGRAHSGSASGAIMLALWAAAIHPAEARAVPPANHPPGCPPQTQVFTSDTVTPIPEGPAIVTSQIVVEGLTGLIWDIDVQTFITHAEPRDLDITLASPLGVVFTLTTDNGHPSSPDCFYGTIWDDQADPGGVLPLSHNPFQAANRSYVGTGPAATLVPEEPFSAALFGGFLGGGVLVDGPWTLTISDDMAGNGGTLEGWSLTITTVPTESLSATLDTGGGPMTPIDITNSTPVAIASGPGTIFSTITLPAVPGPICFLMVETDIEHTNSADLDITLTSPAGTVVTLVTDAGSTFDNVFTMTEWSDFNNISIFGGGGATDQVPYTFNEGLVTDHPYVDLTPAGELTPEESFAAFNGEAMGGVWILTIHDDLAGNAGTLNSWRMRVLSCQQTDTDEDGAGDGCDLLVGDDAAGDDDGDGVASDLDVCAGDDAAGDADADFVCDDLDACAGEDDALDGDADGVPDACDQLVGDDNAGDTDGDGIADDVDNCVDVANADQADADADGAGDACPAPPAGQACCGGGLPAVLPLLLLGMRRRSRRRGR